MLDKNLAILVVESDANRQSWITSTLELLGCKSTTTNSIADAIAAITEKRFDLVLFNQNCSTAQFDLLVDAVESQRYPFHKLTLLAALGNKHTDLPDHLSIGNLTGRLTYPSTINTVGKTIKHWLAHDDSIPGALIPDGYNGYSYKLSLDISAISNPGKGKTTATNRQTPLTAAEQEKLAKISLLLVDDDPISLEIGRDQLEDAAFDVKTADSAAEAISSICQQLPDLVIVNEDLADISGYQLYRQIRGLDQGKKLAIILLTNNLSSSHEKQPDSSSFTDYLSKPTDWKLLTIRIKKMLQTIKTESSLSTTQQQFHNLQKLANVGYADFNIETQQGYTSEGFWVTIGHQPNGAFSMDDFIQVIHPEDRKRYRESVKSSSKNANQIKTQYRVIDASGDIREIITTRQTVLNENGNLANFALSFQDITGQDDHQKIRRLSKYDHLTGFYNPVSFRVEIQHAITMHQLFSTKFALLKIKLNNFSRIREKFNVAAGQQISRDFSNRIQAAYIAGNQQQRLPLEPVFARDGESQFSILIKASGSRAILGLIAERIAECLIKPFSIRPAENAPLQKICLTSSIGIVEFPQDGSEATELENNAETALKRVLDTTKVGFRFFSPELISAPLAELDLEVALHEAIKQQQLTLQYLPVIELNTGTITGFEALLRWHHPTLGEVPPSKIIDLAEQTGMLTKIGNWVITQSCEQLATWHQSGWPGLTLAVNLSHQQFIDPNLINTIIGAISDHQIDPHCLQIEVTEATLMMDLKQTLVILNSLKTVGLRLSIDDFGSGSSSLGALQKLPIDYLKIDRNFIDTIDQPAEKPGVTNAIIAIAKSLDIQVIAEGIETQNQMKFLRTQHCDAGQGFFFSLPLTTMAATHYLEQANNNSGKLIIDKTIIGQGSSHET